MHLAILICYLNLQHLKKLKILDQVSTESSNIKDAFYPGAPFAPLYPTQILFVCLFVLADIAYLILYAHLSIFTFRWPLPSSSAN